MDGNFWTGGLQLVDNRMIPSLYLPFHFQYLVLPLKPLFLFSNQVKSDFSDQVISMLISMSNLPQNSTLEAIEFKVILQAMFQ